MKRMIVAMCIVTMTIVLTACAMWEDPVIRSLGKYDNSQYYISDGFQDYTIYAKYHYPSAEVSENLWLEEIRPEDLEVIQKHLDDYEGWIEAIAYSDPDSEVVVNYDFDRLMIEPGDYIYIDSEENTWSDGYVSFVNYDIYFFDMQTETLYFFHNNI